MSLSPSSPACSRRTFLLGAATTFAGAFLAACGSNPPKEIAATEVPVGSAVILGSVIIAQPMEGEFLAYSSACPHQGNFITKVEGDVVTCTKHNSKFSIMDGSLISGPAATGLSEANLTREGDTLSASVL
ncbi:MAG: Rieske 2Fe-2S domain-containing protein [Corynebacterium sp.]|uniref:Rieske (2Fe-2S) protein n=1 Tax=uncultured Corynebacterium sp. TaxID=159447 RepID=UPI00180C4702|nr:Rieske 2Fe-2S domain-containing protein [uncultured Corynebacterium sp.]NLZ57444.1 Rieske 2Fe-2S domain-containing protein [Corynebacterium sp.]